MAAASSHGAASRRPVVHGGKVVKGLHERTLKDGTIVYECRLRIDGKDRRVVLDARTKTDAVREYAALKVDRDRGVEHENQTINPTVAEVAVEWIAHMQARVGISDRRLSYAQSTIDKNRVFLRLHILPVLGRKRVADVTAADARRFVSHLQGAGLAPMTISVGLATASVLFKFAIQSEYRQGNPFRDLPREDRPTRKRRSEPRYLTGDEVRALIDHAHVDYRALFACMAYVGLRDGEARGLRWKDVDLSADRLTVNGQVSRDGEYTRAKTEESEAPLRIDPALKRELLAHRQRSAARGFARVQPDAYVFPAPRSATPVGHPATYVRLRQAGDAAGLNPPGEERVSPHDLRHTCVTLALEAGATPVEAQELARHTNVTTTMSTYAGRSEDGRGRAQQKMLDAGYGA